MTLNKYQQELKELGFNQGEPEGPWDLWDQETTDGQWTVVALNTADGSVGLEKYFTQDTTMGVTIACSKWDPAVVAILKTWANA